MRSLAGRCSQPACRIPAGSNDLTIENHVFDALFRTLLMYSDPLQIL
jgi:hypothetical protein